MLEDKIEKKSLTIESRYERKYVVPVSSEFLTSWLLAHPALIKKQYPTKNVHSLYLDTPDLTTATHVLDGVANRFKIRLRWYNQKNTIEALRFELKSRHGEVIQKQVQSVLLKSAIDVDDLIVDPLKFFRLSTNPSRRSVYNYLRCWRPSVLVSYERSYYIDDSGQVRITVDVNTTTTRLFSNNQFQASQGDLGIIILELKYQTTAEQTATKIMQSIPISVSRHSKYLFGVLAGV